MKNPWVSLISCGRLKISKCSISLAQLGECSKSKVTPLIEIIMKSSSVKLPTLTKIAYSNNNENLTDRPLL